jgi:hypothetical protein
MLARVGRAPLRARAPSRAARASPRPACMKTTTAPRHSHRCAPSSARCASARRHSQPRGRNLPTGSERSPSRARAAAHGARGRGQVPHRGGDGHAAAVGGRGARVAPDAPVRGARLGARLVVFTAGLVVNTAGLGRLHSRARRLHRAFTEEAHRARAAAAAEVARAHDELAVAKEVAEAAASSARREAAAASAGAT